MSTTTKERYARRKRSEANRLSQQRATPWSDTDEQMSDDQLDERPSDTDSQVSGPASDASDRRMDNQPAGHPVAPAAPAAIPMEALLALTQALKLSNPTPRSEIRPPTPANTHSFQNIFNWFHKSWWPTNQKKYVVKTSSANLDYSMSNGNLEKTF